MQQYVAVNCKHYKCTKSWQDFRCMESAVLPMSNWLCTSTIPFSVNHFATSPCHTHLLLVLSHPRLAVKCENLVNIVTDIWEPALGLMKSKRETFLEKVLYLSRILHFSGNIHTVLRMVIYLASLMETYTVIAIEYFNLNRLSIKCCKVWIYAHWYLSGS